MTEEPQLDLNKRRAVTALGAEARLVHLRVLDQFAETGRPPSRADLERVARDRGIDPAPALAELSERDVVAFDPSGEIRAAYPFSPTPTGHLVGWPGGPTVHAMCAVDALGISAMLGHPVTITTTEPDTGHAIAVDVDADRARWTPDTAVVFAGHTGGTCCPSVDRTCGHINFFTSHRAARDWAARHPDVAGSVLDQHQALAAGIAEFGALLHPDRPSDGRST